MQGALAKEREFYNNRHTTRVVLQNERACVNRYALTYCWLLSIDYEILIMNGCWLIINYELKRLIIDYQT